GRGVPGGGLAGGWWLAWRGWWAGGGRGPGLARRFCWASIRWPAILSGPPFRIPPWFCRAVLRRRRPRCQLRLHVLDLGSNSFRLATGLGVRSRLGSWLGRRLGRLGLVISRRTAKPIGEVAEQV